jgi:hypothetical protein
VGYFNASNVFVGTAANLGNSVILALNGTAGQELKVEFVSKANPNTKKVFYVTLAADKQNFTFDITGLGLVAMINFVQEQVGAANYTVETKGLFYMPVVAGTTYSAAAITSLPGTPTVSSNHGTTVASDTATITDTQLSPTTFNVTSNVNVSGEYTYSTIGWGYFDEEGTFVGTGATLPNSVVLALNGTAGQTLKVEFVSASSPDNKKTFVVTLNATHKNYTFNLTGFGTVGMINFVQDQVGETGYTVETKGLRTLVTGTTYNYSSLTSFGTSSPSLVSGSGNTETGMSLTQISADEFEYVYDLTSEEATYTFASIQKTSPQTFALSSSQYVFAARGSEGGRVKIEITDKNNKKATFFILLSSTLQNFVLNLTPGVGTVPTGFSRAYIKEIVFVQDRNVDSPLLNDYVKIQTKGMSYTPPVLNPDFEETRVALTQEGLDYFDVGVGVDPTTHLPYDNIGDGGNAPGTYTQPTLIGFYAQILGDVVLGEMDNGMTKTRALTEIDTVMNSLLSAQSTYGWNGLLPWLNLGPVSASNDTIGLGDNANLAQSLAAMVGALEGAGLSGADLATVQQIIAKVEQFLDAQEAGYAAFVDSSTGLFRAAYDISDGTFSSYIDRVVSEFRGAVAFLAVRYTSVPDTVWNNLVLTTNSNYEDRNGDTIDNLAAWDGAAFQVFWPSLRNDENGFIGFRNAIYNQLVTQLDYSYQNNIPGILSASSRPEGGYYGNIGIPQIAESNMVSGSTNTVIGDIGSTYALAAATQVDYDAVLEWLTAIDLMSNIDGSYGLFDSARSSDADDINQRYIGIDVASTILGLSGNGPADFTTYLRNRGLEASYNSLYDSMSQKIDIARTDTSLPPVPEFPDRTCAVFSNFSSEGTILGFSNVTTNVYGVRFQYGVLPGSQEGGHYWNLDEVYDAQDNRLLIQYSTVNSPQAVRIELKNASGEVVYQTTQVVAGDNVKFASLTIDLPDDIALSAVSEIDLVVDQAETGDTSGDFTVHSINFQHIPE